MVRRKPKEMVEEIGGEVPRNAQSGIIGDRVPYVARIRVRGTADILFHRWNCESINDGNGNGKSIAKKKGDLSKKWDNVENYVYRDEEGKICIPGEYFRQAIIHAAKFRQDPRSPRKSAMDLFKAAVLPLTMLCSVGKSAWDYLDTRRAVIQRNGINRTRPAMRAGWEAEFEVLVNLPEYVSPSILNDVVQDAGRLVGVGDFRPTYGRFQVIQFDAR